MARGPLIAILFASLAAGCGPPAVADPLRAAAEGREIPSDLRIVYDDMHGFHGGETIRVEADGSVHAVFRLRRDPEAERRASLSPAELRDLLRLLVAIEAWDQREPERQPVPDESRARLAVRAGGHEAGIWEWYSDLRDNGRMVRVKTWLERRIPAPR